jgi:hypothetical protein
MGYPVFNLAAPRPLQMSEGEEAVIAGEVVLRLIVPEYVGGLNLSHCSTFL